MRFSIATLVLMASSGLTAANLHGMLDLTFQEYKKGDVLSDLGNGVHLSALKRKNNVWIPGQAMIFDSANPTGGDWDLGTPNEKHGGPGKGGAGESGLNANTLALGNLVIVSEDEDSNDPDDNVGGILMFTFDDPVLLENCVLVDNEETSEFDVMYDNGVKKSIFLGGGGDNSVETVTFHDKAGFEQPIVALNITMQGSGAIGFVGVRNAEEAKKVVKLPPGTCQSDFHFDSTSGLEYSDDVFRGTNNPKYAEGKIMDNGLMSVRLGAIDGSSGTQLQMSGGFSKSFSLMEDSAVSISVKCQLSMISYEKDEFAEVLVSVDGELIGKNGADNVMRIIGSVKGNGGLQTIELDPTNLSAGDHTLTIGGFNNKKTASREVSDIRCEYVEIEALYGCAVPTDMPTTSPTKAPTDKPTTSPTMAPTDKPTTSPTKAPTDKPTKGPTKAPTDQPTKGPTKAPTDKPTKGPTKAPTGKPTMAPVTKSPTSSSPVSKDIRFAVKPDQCIESNWIDAGKTEELICAGRKVFFESGQSKESVDCTVGEKVRVTVNGSIRFSDDTPRYDVAWYVATDGGDAMTGTCDLTPLSEDVEYSVVNMPGGDQVVGSVVWEAGSDGDGDQCGDVMITAGTSGASIDAQLVLDLEVPCADENEDGLLDFAVCFTWRQDCNNDVCSFDAVIPGNPTTGCYCTRVNIENTQVDQPNPIKPC